jgi:GT2 family glycosyltransferase
VKIEPRPVLRDITVVIPTLGRPILERSLEHIAAGDAWPARIVVVDQSSSAAIAAWLAELRAAGLDTEHVPSSQRGRARGVNRGIERTTTRFVAITDDDCFVEADWLRKLRDRLLESPDAVVTGRVDPAGDEEVTALVTSREPAVYTKPGLLFDPVSGGNMGTSLAVFERVGLLEESPAIACSEDGEWAYRAVRNGVRILYDPEIAVRHYGWRDAGERAAQYVAYARSHGAFYGMYLAQGDAFIAQRAALHLLRAAKRWLSAALSGDREEATRWRAYLVGIPPGIRAGFSSYRAARARERRGEAPR